MKGMKGFVGNSHEYDEKRGKALMKTTCGDGDVNLLGFQRLAARAKPVTKFPYAVCDELRTQMKCRKHWDKLTMSRRQCSDFDTVLAKINAIDPTCLVGGEGLGKKRKGGGNGNGGSSSSGSSSSGSSSSGSSSSNSKNKSSGGKRNKGGSKKKSKYAAK